ncbi:TadE family protein [Streptomyces sp. MS19]|uniref:TadE family protein n=1 Tax=Streptomyces sp. MS19 TaxID=3385972 RepID=UPI0039A27649
MRRGRAQERDRGVTAIEFAGWLPILLIVALAALQLGVAGYAALQAGSAARAAARLAAQEETEDAYVAGGLASLSDALADDASVERTAACGDEATVTVSVRVPTVLPFLPDLTASRTVTMPCD